MATPRFATGSDLEWTRSGRRLEASTGEVSFVAEAPWYASRWTVRGTSALVLPLDITLYVSRGGAAHGYWANAWPGLREYFGYSDQPALMPLIVGERVRRAIATHDDPRATDYEALDRHQPVALHIRTRMIETTSVVEADNDRVIIDQRAIHRALAADHAEIVETWQTAATGLGGTVASSWPPVLTVPRAFGSTTISLCWSRSERRAAPAWIELSTDARGAPVWTMEDQESSIPNGRMIGGRTFLVTGTAAVDLAMLGPIVARTQIRAIDVRRNIVVRIASSQPEVPKLEELLGLLAVLCGSTGPYR